MKTTIDHAGRIVIPKAIRERAGLYGGSEVEVQLTEGVVELRPLAGPARLERRGRFLVAVAPADSPSLTTDLVEAELERLRLRAAGTGAGEPGDAT